MIHLDTTFLVDFQREAEDGQGVRRDRRCGDVHAERGQLARDLEQRRDHQEESLTRRVRRREGSRPST